MSVPAAKSAPPMSKRRQMRRLAFIVAVPVVAALVYLLPALVMREPDLMNKSRKVAGTDITSYRLEEVVWRPDGAIIERRQINTRKTVLARIDPQTGANTILHVFDPEFSHNLSNYTLDAKLSPGGDTLLLRETSNRMVRYKTMFVAHRPPRIWAPVPLVMNHEQIWLPNASGWFEAVQAGKKLALTVHPLSGPPTGATLTLPWDAKAWPGFSVGPAGILLTTAYVDGPPPDKQIHCWHIHATPDKIETLPFTLPLPGGVDQVGDAALSPQGDRVAFGVLRLAKPHPILKWLHLANMDSHASYEKARFSLWTCRTDGSNLHEVGLAPEGVHGLYTFGWTPDGKAIWFRTADAIYTVPGD